MRSDFHKRLESLGCRAYFQPPSNVSMGYPCIVYELDRIVKKRADNGVYLKTRRYQVKLITKNPDDPMVDALASMVHSEFERHYTADLLNHFVFSIYDIKE